MFDAYRVLTSGFQFPQEPLKGSVELYSTLGGCKYKLGNCGKATSLVYLQIPACFYNSTKRASSFFYFYDKPLGQNVSLGSCLSGKSLLVTEPR